MSFDNQSPMQPPRSKRHNGVGDYAQAPEPHQKYWQVVDKGRVMPPQKPIAAPPELQIAKPDGSPLCSPDQLQLIKCIAEVVARTVKEHLQCATFFTHPPTWQKPPISGVPVDLFTVGVGRNIPARTTVTALSYRVPDRHVLVIDRFGNNLEAPAAFADMTWTLRHGGTPFTQYQAFTAQLGDPVDPTAFPYPLISTSNELFEVVVQNTGVVDHRAFIRATGWTFAVRELSQDGSWSTWHNP